MEDYRVQLDVYDGPMDLLLYLVRKEELDIHDIPIARITEQYCRYVDLLRAVDINLAGEFMVMAAWLMEIKTRMLLPADVPPPEDGSAPTETAAVDPRAELVRQLLAYKRFKDLAGELGDAAAAQALKFPRAGIDWEQLAGEQEPALDIDDVQVWDLFERFGKLMEQTGRLAPHQVSYDDTPIHEHQAEIIERVTTAGATRFEDFFAGRGRSEMVGLFLAMLELIRQKRIRIQQLSQFGPIEISLRQDAPAEGGGSVASAHPNDDATIATPADKPDGEPADRLAATRRGARHRREAAEPVGVTWVENEEEELVDQELRKIDLELKAIQVAETILEKPPPGGAGVGPADRGTGVSPVNHGQDAHATIEPPAAEAGGLPEATQAASAPPAVDSPKTNP